MKVNSQWWNNELSEAKGMKVQITDKRLSLNTMLKTTYYSLYYWLTSCESSQSSVTLWVQRNIHSRCLQLVWFFAVLLSALPHCRIFSKSTTTREWLTCIWDTLQFRKTFFKKKKGVETVKPKFSVDTLKDNVDNAKSCQWKRFILQFAVGVFLSRWQGRCLYY